MAILISCGKKKAISSSQTSDGYIWLKNSELQLRFDDEFGNGKRLILKGNAIGPKNCIMEKTMTVEMYEAYPNVAITYATYKNTGSAVLTVNRIFSNQFILDATLSETTKKPYEFWMFQGPAYEYGKDYIFPLNDTYSRENHTGLKHNQLNERGGRIVGGGGLPIVDFWTETFGLGIAIIEPVPKFAYFPVKVLNDQNDQKVEIAIREDVNKQFTPGEYCQTLKTAIITHHLDFFDCLHSFTQLVGDEGVKMKTPSEGSYEPVWCSWGYLTDFTAEQIPQTLPNVHALGSPWVVVDEDWFDFYVDWNTRTDLWPGGDQDMMALVDTLRQMGLKVTLWWVPTDVQGDVKVEKRETPIQYPGPSEIVKEHPEWLIMGENGSYPKSDRHNYYLCPSLPDVQEYIRLLTTRLISSNA